VLPASEVLVARLQRQAVLLRQLLVALRLRPNAVEVTTAVTPQVGLPSMPYRLGSDALVGRVGHPPLT
jgi:hypothetical protein